MGTFINKALFYILFKYFQIAFNVIVKKNISDVISYHICFYTLTHFRCKTLDIYDSIHFRYDSIIMVCSDSSITYIGFDFLIEGIFIYHFISMIFEFLINLALVYGFLDHGKI